MVAGHVSRMVAGLLVNGCWVCQSTRLLGCSSLTVAGNVIQWLLGCQSTVVGKLFNGCSVIIQWLLGCRLKGCWVVC